jgi:hypothetical protein
LWSVIWFGFFYGNQMVLFQHASSCEWKFRKDNLGSDYIVTARLVYLSTFSCAMHGCLICLVMQDVKLTDTKEHGFCTVPFLNYFVQWGAIEARSLPLMTLEKMY